jgi:hypothetical protein
MFLVLHIIIALTSIVYATAIFIAPQKLKFSLEYWLVAATIASGTYLVFTNGSHILQACLTGLAYLGTISLLIVAAHAKLSKMLS